MADPLELPPALRGKMVDMLPRAAAPRQCSRKRHLSSGTTTTFVTGDACSTFKPRIPGSATGT